MKRCPQNPPRLQQTPDELIADLLHFLRRKFYAHNPKAFYTDRRHLLRWVVLWPAKWLDDKSVSLTPDQYKKVFFHVFLEAEKHGQKPSNINFLPAWLAKVIHSYFDHHGEAIYNRAKGVRNLTETVMLRAGKLPTASSHDPVSELAAAARLLKPKKQAPKPPKKDQLNLL